MKRFFFFAFATAAVAAALAQGMNNQPGTRANGLFNRGGAFPNRAGTPFQPGVRANANPAAGQQGGAASVASPGSEAYASAAAGEDQECDLNFVGADLGMVFQVYSSLVGKTILRDPAIADKPITLKSEKGQKLTKEEQIQAIEMVLEMNDVHLEPYAEKFIRAVPRSGASKEVPTMVDSESLGESGKVVSMVVRLNYVSYEEAMKILQEVATAKAKLQGIERTNSILITDTELNMKRMLDLVKQFDVESKPVEEVKTYQIRYASAADIQQVLQKIVEESQKELDKNGKGVNNNANAMNQPPWMRGPGANMSVLNGRRTTGQPNQPASSASTSSILSSISDADRGLIRGKVLILSDERSNKLVIITSAANHKFFKSIIDDLDVETTPETEVKVYRLKYAEAEEVSDMINDLIGNAPTAKSGSKQNQNQNAQAGRSTNVTTGGAPAQRAGSVNKRTGEAGTGELSKDNTTVLADKRINGLVVMTRKELVPVVERIIESMDVKLSQVLIETVIIEVTLGDDLKTGVDWVQKGRSRQQRTDSSGKPLYWQEYTADIVNDEGKTVRQAGQKTGLTTDESSWVESSGIVHLLEPVIDLAKDGYVNNGHYMLGGGGSTTKSLAELIAGTANPIGTGINYLLKSDKLNLAAIIEASKSDSRTKYLASPVVMTVDNKEATINATRMKYLLKGFTSSGNSYSTIAVPDYEQKELGIEIKVKPKINPNGTVMLTVEEKYSQLGVEQEIKYAKGNSASTSSTIGDLTGQTSSSLEAVMVPTTVTREMTADVILDNLQTVVFGGLVETTETESETGIPILKDIPLIGKWLFGSVTKTESRNELLVFMTPYVLDDAESAQVEALRRKKTMSDTAPWTDHGWSLSELADPVSKREQLRRLKEEWQRQDEERKTKLAIEDEKIKRAKELEKMSKEERDHWLELHKDELEKEKRKELKKMMQDEESQDFLKELAAEVRKRKGAEAQAAIDEADAAQKAENERGRIEAEKKSKKEPIKSDQEAK